MDEKRTGEREDLDLRVKLSDLFCIDVGGDCTGSSDHTDLAVPGCLDRRQCSRLGHSEHIDVAILLNHRQCKRRGGIARHDNHLDTLFEQESGVLSRELDDDIF